MNPSFCVQHHPSRTYLLPRLLERLPGFELVTDPDPYGKPSPLRTYIECMERTPPGASHRVVIQDDAWPCEGFADLAEYALAEKPDKIVAFFVPGLKSAGARRVRRAVGARERWAQIGGLSICPLVATAWPAHLIQPFIDFARSSRIQARYSHDDPVAALFVNSRKLEVWATVPSLVQHPDRAESLIGRRARAGKDAARVAAMFIDA